MSWLKGPFLCCVTLETHEKGYLNLEHQEICWRNSVGRAASVWGGRNCQCFGLTESEEGR